MLVALIAALALIIGSRYPAGTMNARGERILIFGDSLTQHASGNNPIWNVDQGAQRASSGPGDLLASLLLEQGAQAVRTNALVSRSAYNFWTREQAQALVAADLAWRPTKVIFVLGTNDVGLAPGPDEAAFVRLRDAYRASGAELWAIGPFQSRLSAAQVAQVAATMRRVFGARFIDGRAISALISPGSDGVHYTPTSARLLALAMADALLSAFPRKAWAGIAIGVAIVVGGGLVYSFVKSGRTGMLKSAAPMSKFKVIRRQDRETQSNEDHPGAAPPRQSELDVGSDRTGWKPLYWKRVLVEHKKSGGNAIDLDLWISHAPNAHTPFSRMDWPDPLDVRGAERFAQQLIEDGGAQFVEVNARARRPYGASAVYTLANFARADDNLDGTRLSGLEIVNGKKHGGSVNELIRAGYRQVPCKSGLDKGGLARCWTGGRGGGR